MSFYGSIYYQAGEAITKIFIQNFGKNHTGFQEAEVEDEVPILADGRKGSFYLNGGNRWITLKGDSENNLCTIYHNKPDEANLNQYIVPFQKTDIPPMGAQIIELPLSDDVYFAAPAIYYDEAGHMIPTGNLMYFKIPKIAIQQGIDSLTERITAIETNDEDQNNRIRQVEQVANGVQADHRTLSKLVGYKDAMTQNEDLTVTSAIGNMDRFRQTVSDGEASLADKLGEMYVSYTDINASYRNLDTDIRKLQARLDAAGL